jgi:riboflavin synthase|tara:strand:- start:235 stop:816 length:582 start_codon:yes stop_codon:yes gene_type:complete
MFTGIIESLGEIKSLTKEGSNVRVEIDSTLLNEIKVDQSIAHNGICLTVEKINPSSYEVVAVKETIDKTNLGAWLTGQKVNLERCMQMNARLDGHIVQGHVDETATVQSIIEEKGSWIYTFQLQNPSKLIVEKGSICINGTSLTAFNITDNSFEVTIIPYTYEHTIFHQLVPGSLVNIEFDIVGKYIQRMVQV